MKQKKTVQKKLGFDSKQKPEEGGEFMIDFENLKVLGGDSSDEIYLQGYYQNLECVMNVNIKLLNRMFKYFVEFKVGNYQRKQTIETKVRHIFFIVEAEYNNEMEIPFYYVTGFSKILKTCYAIKIQDN